jgi:NADPH:quinone reductase-like Zn-dependent oxidoreductase
MKAIQVSSFGAPEVLRLAELPDPPPGRVKSPSTSPTQQLA